MRTRFWGVRGSIACPGVPTIKYGGNTACVEVRLSDDNLLIFDCGTGIRDLGRDLMKKKEPIHATIFLSHGHMDHVYGFPFFAPAYMKNNNFIVRGCPPENHTLKEMLQSQMGDVYFPVEFDGLSAEIEFDPCCIHCACVGSAEIKTYPTNHPGGGRGFRIEEKGRSVIYLTDNELRSEAKDAHPFEEYVAFCKDADLLIHDTQYTEEEYGGWTKGWGHSRNTDVAELCVKAGVKQVALFHHDPDHDDAFLEKFLEDTRRLVRDQGGSTECLLATEGRTLTV